MIRCPKCHTELSENDMFCFVCGHKMDNKPDNSQQADQQVLLKPCPVCQTMPTSPEDVFCAECGFRLIPEVQKVQDSLDETGSPAEEPSIKEVIVQAEVSENIQEIPKTGEQPHPQTEKQPIPKLPVAEQTIVSTPVVAKRKKGRWVLWFLLILILLIVAGGGIYGFLIHNGTVSRNQAEVYVPKAVLDLIPVGQKEIVATASRYFVVYGFGQFDKQPAQKGRKIVKEKRAVISDVFTNIDAGSETNDGAEVAFRNAGNSQITKFSRFSKYFVNSFATNLEAMKERENIIKDLKSKGYKTEFVRVVK